MRLVFSGNEYQNPKTSEQYTTNELTVEQLCMPNLKKKKIFFMEN